MIEKLPPLERLDPVGWKMLKGQGDVINWISQLALKQGQQRHDNIQGKRLRP